MTTRQNFAGGAISVTTSRTDLYVSDINGNDSWDGSAANPLKTIGRATDVLAGVLGYVAVIHVGRHAGAGYAPPRIQSNILNANLWIVGDGAGQPGETGFTSIRASVAAAAGSTANQIVVTGGGMVVDAYRGQTVRVTTGAAAGDYRTIRNNDANNLYPVRPFSAAVAAGDLYEVVEPDVIWNFDTPFLGQDPILVGNMNGGRGNPASFQYGVYFNNFKWTGPATSTYSIYGSRVVFCGIQCDTVIANVQLPIHNWSASEIGLGQDQIVSGASQASFSSASVDMGATSATSWLGWTLSQRTNCTAPGVSMNGVNVHGSIVTNSVGVNGDAVFACIGGNFFGGGATNAVAVAGGTASFVGASGCNILMANAGANATLIASTGARVSSMQNVTVANSVGWALEARSSQILNVATTATGTGATIGAIARNGGQITFSGAPGFTGAAGADLCVDSTAAGGLGVAFAVATLAASGDYISRDDGSIILRA